MNTQKVGRVFKSIKIRMSAKELNQHRDSAADIQLSLDQTCKELADVMAAHKEAKHRLDGAIEGFRCEISKLLREIREKKATLEADVDEVKNLDNGTIEYWHPNLETGECVDEREMTEEEKQLTLIQEKAEQIPESGMEIVD